ncbi:hypothetical protein [Aestuariivirga litoralis]|uniref:hypothetical protein n=1 Tax=Aestuariivirga litoralis TaxID=2650924 RepID=UPI0018C66140|nr:hypothetical protein [Aestuariivirga litoralis]MBG1233723.1 hypothetical protein [Aestuariivirga litoralis]
MWWKLNQDLFAASFEAQRVIALRLMKINQGGAAAEKESQRMISEKMSAAMEAATTLATGGSSAKVLRRYRTIMKANTARLSKTRRRSK